MHEISFQLSAELVTKEISKYQFGQPEFLDNFWNSFSLQVGAVSISLGQGRTTDSCQPSKLPCKKEQTLGLLR